MEHNIPSMVDARATTTGDASPDDRFLQAFDEAAHDADAGLANSPALRAAEEEVYRRWAAARPPPARGLRFRGSPLVLVAVGVALVVAWTLVPWWWLLAGVVGLAAVYERDRHLEVRRHRHYRRGACYSCGYSLDGLADAIAPCLIGRLHVGPATCPECGTRWPRLPPE